jgi:hypothetical protein
MTHPPEVTAVQELLHVGATDAKNIVHVLELAMARGRAGRWPDQDFEQAADWDDGLLIDRICVIADIASSELFALYLAAHAHGLAMRVAAGEAVEQPAVDEHGADGDSGGRGPN